MPDANDDGCLRRHLLHAGGVGVAALGLAACGGADATSGTSTSGTTSSTETASSSAGGTRVPLADIPVGGGVIDASTKVVVTQPTEGEVRAFTAVCTHQGCIVSSVSETINCACHGSAFSITDGSVVTGPATQPLPAMTAVLEGADVVVG